MSEQSPSEPTPLTPEALDSLLSDLDHASFVAFVADLRERAGWEVDRERAADGESGADSEGSVLVASRPDGERERLLVWTDERGRLDRLLDTDPEPPAPPAAGETVDAVVARSRDAEAAAAVAEARNARLIDADDLHDRLLYAIDRESCRDLCATHFDRAVDPRPAPEPDDPGRAGPFQPRVLLVGVALLGLVVAGGAGLPGGPGDDPAPGAVDSPPGTAGVNPVGAPTETPDTPEPTSDTPTPTGLPWLDPPTDTPGTPVTPDPPEECSGDTGTSSDAFPASCATLASFNAPELTVAPGTTTTINATVTNPYLFNITDAGVELRAPANWTVAPVTGTTFERLSPQETLTVAWNLTVPADAAGEYELRTVSTYSSSTDTARAVETHAVTVDPDSLRPPAVPPCTEAGTCYLLTVEGTPTVAPGETTTVTGTLYNPRNFTLANGSVELRAPANWTVAPVAGTTFERLEPGEVRIARWNVTAPASANATVDLTAVTNYTRPGSPDFPNVTTSNTYPVEIVDGNATNPGGHGDPPPGPSIRAVASPSVRTVASPSVRTVAGPSVRATPRARPGTDFPSASRGTR